MNNEVLKTIQPHLNILGVKPISMLFNSFIDNFAITKARAGLEPSFSRIHWTPSRVGVSDAMNGDGEPLENTQKIISFLIDTKIELAAQTIEGIIPEGVPIPDELIIAKFEVGFAIDYISAVDPTTFSAEAVEEFAKFNAPFHMWPYWRELVQNICLRSQLPVVALPMFRVPDANDQK